jgi:hypothetical protein
VLLSLSLRILTLGGVLAVLDLSTETHSAWLAKGTIVIRRNRNKFLNIIEGFIFNF